MSAPLLGIKRSLSICIPGLKDPGLGAGLLAICSSRCCQRTSTVHAHVQRSPPRSSYLPTQPFHPLLPHPHVLFLTCACAPSALCCRDKRDWTVSWGWQPHTWAVLLWRRPGPSWKGGCAAGTVVWSWHANGPGMGGAHNMLLKRALLHTPDPARAAEQVHSPKLPAAPRGLRQPGSH